MATVEPYPTKSGKRYRVRYRTPDRRQTDKRGFRTKREAEAFAATVEVEKMRGEYVSPSLGRVSVGELAGDWLVRKQTDMRPSSYRAVEVSWRKHVEPRWGLVKIVDVDLDAIERWIAEMSRTITDDQGTILKKGSGASVVLRAYGVLAGILDSAVKARRLSSNPARTPENLPKKRPKPRTYLTHTQVEALAEQSKYPTLIRLLAYTGLRWGEAIALRVEHVDLRRKRLTVVDNAVQIDQVHVVGLPKSGQVRWVSIPEFLVFDLRALTDDREPHDLVFDNGRGGHLRRSVSSSGWFAAAVERSGVPFVTVHDLRHTAASLAVAAGVHVKALQRMLGHASAAMTLDVYSDLFDEDLDGVGVALGRARLAAGVGEMWATTPPDMTAAR